MIERRSSVADFATSTGTRPEGIGVVPDRMVAWTREDLPANRDPALEAAAWIADFVKRSQKR